MDRTIFRAFLAVFFLVAVPATAQQGALSVCDYKPPESRISDLGLQGSFSWYDGPYADDRNRTVAATLVADYTGMLSSASSGQSLTARGELRGANDGWSADLSGSGSTLTFLTNDLFGIGVIGVDGATQSDLELDLTGGVGAGRFRDVTPLARAIRIQNALLDVAELLAPVDNDTLLEMAQILGETGPTDNDKVVSLVDRLVATGLVPGNEVGVRGLLAVEEVLQSSDATRLCGRDIQARIGASAILLPEFSVAATGILLVRLASVPDPVSQFDSSAQVKVRLARPEELGVDAEASYVRSLPDGWTARGNVRVSLDRMWSRPGETTVLYSASASLTTQIFGSVGISLIGDAQYRTGDEEITLSLAVHMEASLF